MKLFDEYPNLESEYIAIHRLRSEDAEGIRKLAEDPKVSATVPTFLYENKYEDKALVIEREEAELFRTGEGILLGIYLKGEPTGEADCAGEAGETFVGLAEIYGYDEAKNKASIGARILPEFWRRGISTETARLLRDYLIDDLGLRTVTAHILKNNFASAACVLKNGFVAKYCDIYEDWGMGEPMLTDKYVFKNPGSSRED